MLNFFYNIAKKRGKILLKGVLKMDNKLKELRLKKEYNGKLGMTQQEVADEIGVTKRTYIYWEKGERQIKPEKAQKLADFFEVPVGYLLGYESDEILLENLAKKVMNLSKEEFIEYSKTEDYQEEYKLFEELYKKSEILNQKKTRVKQLKEIISLLEGLDTNDLDILYPIVERLYFSRYSLEENEEFNKYRQTLKNEVRNPQ